MPDGAGDQDGGGLAVDWVREDGVSSGGQGGRGGWVGPHTMSMAREYGKWLKLSTYCKT